MQVASVVGDSVPIGILHEIYPIEATEESIERDLNALEAAAFVRRSDRNGYFQFCQVCDKSNFLHIETLCVISIKSQ